MNHITGALRALCLAASACALATAAQAASFAPATGKLFLVGQSNRAAWDNWNTIGQEANGGSVYYELKAAAFNTGRGSVPIHQGFADLVTSKSGKFLQVGVSWKDNPPGWNGDNAAKEQASKNATQALANGSYLNLFDNLINYINSKQGTKFLLRLDYEVSSAFHCTDASCNSYKGAFNSIAAYIRGRVAAGNVAFVYHPVRGEFAQLYPGDANVDWIGLSVFNHELCMPIYNQTSSLYNGTPGSGFDVASNQCKGYILQTVNGNLNAAPQSFNYDMNVLEMVKFSKDHGKPMIYSESSPMNFVAGQNGDGTDSDALSATWANRYFGLMNYNGPLPNRAGSFDLSGVIKAVVYMNLDLRYGWDGYYGQTDGFAFPYDDMWFNNVQLPLYASYKTAFCNGLSAQGFLAQCGTGGGGGGGGGGTVPAAPSALSATQASTTSVAVGWADNAGNESDFQIERLVGTGAWNDLAVVGANARSYTNTGLDIGTRYQYRVRARNSAGASAWSNVGDVTLSGGEGGGGSTNLPGVVTTTAFGGSKSYTVNVTAAGSYYFVISYSSSANSKLVTTGFNGGSANAAVDSGTGSVQTVDFSGVGTGSKTLTVTAESGAMVTKVEAFRR